MDAQSKLICSHMEKYVKAEVVQLEKNVEKQLLKFVGSEKFKHAVERGALTAVGKAFGCKLPNIKSLEEVTDFKWPAGKTLADEMDDLAEHHAKARTMW